jgi:hypothetical protein
LAEMGTVDDKKALPCPGVKSNLISLSSLFSFLKMTQNNTHHPTFTTMKKKTRAVRRDSMLNYRYLIYLKYMQLEAKFIFWLKQNISEK